MKRLTFLPLLILVLFLVPFQQAHAWTSGIIYRGGINLYLDGSFIRATGYNYHWTGYNCPAPTTTQFDSVFSAIKTASKGRIVRTAFYQAAYQPGSNNPWSVLDQWVSYANKYGLKLVPILTNNWRDCEPAQAEKFLPWYQSGYTAKDPGYSMSYLSWAQAVAQHYAGNPAIAWWQLINEPDARNSNNSCSESSAASALRSFADKVTSTIKTYDPQHMVDLGSISWCGGQGSDFQYVMGGSVDLCDVYHDYSGATSTWPSQLNDRLNACNNLNKPSFIGEAGICGEVSSTGSCGSTVTSTTLNNRSNFFQNKLYAAFVSHYIHGYLIWTKSSCCSNGWNVGPNDPTEYTLSRYAV
jgi:mannan endo-1,4-beta-mannosidase